MARRQQPPSTLEPGLAAAVEAVRVAADAVASLTGRPTDGLATAMAMILEAPGRVVVTGLGKSGLVGAKLAATLSSTGTPASFVHAADALHGDSGIVRRGDVLLAISSSGETDEVCAFAAMVAGDGVRVIAMTGCGNASRLAACADVVLDISVERECDPHSIVPSASTTATLVVGDALAVGLMRARDFGPEQFRKHHPGGSLGRALA